MGGLDRRIEKVATLATLSTLKTRVARESGAMSEQIRDPRFWITFGKLFHRRASTNNRRAKRLGATGTIDTSDLANQYDKQNGLCFYCFRPLNDEFQIDHAIPLSRGGYNTKENIVLSCFRCNSSKGIGKIPRIEKPSPDSFEGTNSVVVSTKVPPALAEYINDWCSDHHQSVSEVIREIILDWVRQETQKSI